MIVVDNSVIVALFFDEEDSDLVRQVRVKDNEWIAPPLWRSEFQNVAITKVRKGATDSEGALLRYRWAEEIVETREMPPVEVILDLALRHRLSAYDATYAALGITTAQHHVTFDEAILRAGLGIHPRDFLNL